MYVTYKHYKPSFQNGKSLGAEILRDGSPPHTCHVSGVTCHVSHVMCHLSHVQGSEKWIAQIAALLYKMPSVGQIRLRKYDTIHQTTYNFDNVKQNCCMLSCPMIGQGMSNCQMVGQCMYNCRMIRQCIFNCPMA